MVASRTSFQVWCKDIVDSDRPADQLAKERTKRFQALWKQTVDDFRLNELTTVDQTVEASPDTT